MCLVSGIPLTPNVCWIPMHQTGVGQPSDRRQRGIREASERHQRGVREASERRRTGTQIKTSFLHRDSIYKSIKRIIAFDST